MSPILLKIVIWLVAQVYLAFVWPVLCLLGHAPSHVFVSDHNDGNFQSCKQDTRHRDRDPQNDSTMDTHRDITFDERSDDSCKRDMGALTPAKEETQSFEEQCYMHQLSDKKGVSEQRDGGPTQFAAEKNSKVSEKSFEERCYEFFEDSKTRLLSSAITKPQAPRQKAKKDASVASAGTGIFHLQLYEAIRTANIDLLDDAIKHGADVNKWLEITGTRCPSLSYCCDCISLHERGNSATSVQNVQNLLQIMRRLCEANAKVNQLSSHHATPIMYAARLRTHEAYELLLEFGANPSHRGPANVNILHYLFDTRTGRLCARLKNCENIFGSIGGDVKRMVNAHLHDGAEGITPEGITPLLLLCTCHVPSDVAEKQQYFAAIDLLLAHGASPEKAARISFQNQNDGHIVHTELVNAISLAKHLQNFGLARYLQMRVLIRQQLCDFLIPDLANLITIFTYDFTTFSTARND